MKKAIPILIIVVVISVLLYQNFFKKESVEYSLVKVTKTDVIEEISETGQVKKEEQINLSFRQAGLIEEIYVVLGQEVEEGDLLARLDDDQLKIQLDQAKANKDLYQAQLDKLIAGASVQDIQTAQTSVDNAQVSLNIASQDLKDIERQGNNNLKAAYEDALTALGDAYIKISNALNTTDLIQRTYFTNQDQQGVSVRENKQLIEIAKNTAKVYLDAASQSQAYPDIDLALSQMKSSLQIASNSLKTIREVCEDDVYKTTVSITYKGYIDTDRGYVSTALINTVNSQQTISSTITTNEISINTYQGRTQTAQGALKAAQDNLASITASPRQEDISLYQAQLSHAQAQVSLLEQQLQDAVLKAPLAGQIVKISKQQGELAQASLQDAVLVLLPKSQFKIEVDIYEEDVAKINYGDPVQISLVAFPDNVLQGKVTLIDPVEKLKDGVVYYEVSVSLIDYPQGIKPGMTADIAIRTDFKQNVLAVPKIALTGKNGQRFVEVLENGQFKEKEVFVGLEGSNDLIEILSGLSENEEIVVR